MCWNFQPERFFSEKSTYELSELDYKVSVKLVAAKLAVPTNVSSQIDLVSLPRRFLVLNVLLSKLLPQIIQSSNFRLNCLVIQMKRFNSNTLAFQTASEIQSDSDSKSKGLTNHTV